MNSPKARPIGRRDAWRLARPSRRGTVLCASILVCLGGSVGQAQQGPQLTVNYREADIRMVTEQVQAVIGRARGCESPRPANGHGVPCPYRDCSIALPVVIVGR